MSSALVSGDLRAYISNLFDQASWNGSFLDAIQGAAATATYNDVLAPIVVTNAGAITERWAIQFTNATSFNVIGEHVDVIATGTTGSDIAPINPATGKPYFTLAAIGWGSGWATGNVLRFNTTGALFPVVGGAHHPARPGNRHQRRFHPAGARRRGSPLRRT